MNTTHSFFAKSSTRMSELGDNSIQLTVTSPPYPMIQMWDDIFGIQDKSISKFLDRRSAQLAFEAMHEVLDKVWSEVYRVSMPGAIVCINIGDATRSFNGHFQLFSNHSRVIGAMIKLGFVCLPSIIWQKTTNAPNKFMGAGMLSPGAYVTLEHEYILIFRKGSKRNFISLVEKENRAKSAYFWEERNKWFSDTWNLAGCRQKLETSNTRSRSGAFPFEIPWRLINMFSVYGDTVLDPFMGIGTTSLAAIGAARSSVGYEIDKSLLSFFTSSLTSSIIYTLNKRTEKRLAGHVDYIEAREVRLYPLQHKHTNCNYQFPVVTRQEKQIELRRILLIKKRRHAVQIFYETIKELSFS